MDFDQFQAPSGEFRVDGLDEGAFAHAARAPEQGVVGRKPARETFRIVEQKIAHAVDAAQKRQFDAVDLRHRLHRRRRGVPDKGVGGVEIGRDARWRREPVERVGDASEQGGRIGSGVGGHGKIQKRQWSAHLPYRFGARQRRRG